MIVCKFPVQLIFNISTNSHLSAGVHSTTKGLGLQGICLQTLMSLGVRFRHNFKAKTDTELGMFGECVGVALRLREVGEDPLTHRLYFFSFLPSPFYSTFLLPLTSLPPFPPPPTIIPTTTPTPRIPFPFFVNSLSHSLPSP